MGDRPVTEVDPTVLGRCYDVLTTTPSALITDIDGTISPIASTPADAAADPVAVDALSRLVGRLALTGIVTGRSAAVAEAMVAVPGMIYIGNHGMERRGLGPDWSHPEASAGAETMAAALKQFAETIRERGQDAGVVIENKRLSGSIHYRLAPDQEAARLALVPLAVEIAEQHGLVVTSGRQILELRPSIVVNKGTAIVDLIKTHSLRGVVFLGDDLTDVDGFRALRVLRESGEVESALVAVLSAETHRDVIETTDLTVDGVDGCAALLTALADRLVAEDDDGPAATKGDR
jgi:trehalose 6-phosphate phosphatase